LGDETTAWNSAWPNHKFESESSSQRRRLWCCLIFAAAFRRRFHEFHRTAPLLAALCQGRCGGGDLQPTSRFVPTSSFRPAQPPATAGSSSTPAAAASCWSAGPGERPPEDRACRLGPRHRQAARAAQLADAVQRVPAQLGRGRGLRRRRQLRPPRLPLGSFLVVSVDIKHDKMCSCTYSSELAAWSEQTFSELRCRYDHYCFKPEPGVLMGNALYVLFHSNHGIVKYDLATREASTIDMRPAFHPQHIVLVTMDDGRLGFATMDNCRLKVNLWSRVVGRDKDARFVQCGVIDLPKALNALKTSPHVSGFAHGAGVLFIWTYDGLYSMDIKSEEVRKVPGTRYCHVFADVVPYSSFHTPGTALLLYDRFSLHSQHTVLFQLLT
jgi:hypothetical protein